MSTGNDSSASYALRKILTLEATEFAPAQQWFWERDRWSELLFALISRLSSLNEHHLRRAVEALSSLGLLDVPSLASSTIEDWQRGTHAERIRDVLQENGLTPAESQKCLTTMREAAVVVQEHYDGKIQKYLRHYGELMLEDLKANFHFSEMREDDVQYAFAYWLQNVLNIPVSLFDRSLLEFCEAEGITAPELIEAADELDVNLAFVDDLIHSHIMQRTATTKAPPAAKAAANVQAD